MKDAQNATAIFFVGIDGDDSEGLTFWDYNEAQNAADILSMNIWEADWPYKGYSEWVLIYEG